MIRKGKRSKGQFVRILKEAQNGIPVVELCRKHGAGECTF